jgi:hypothetical protein
LPCPIVQYKKELPLVVSGLLHGNAEAKTANHQDLAVFALFRLLAFQQEVDLNVVQGAIIGYAMEINGMYKKHLNFAAIGRTI